MKEIYAWVPWFKELARKIDEGGEGYLVERAKRVAWGKDNPSLLRYGDENVDPFSFIYFLAQRCTTNQVQPVYTSVSEVFEIDGRELLGEQSRQHGLIFPIPQSRVNSLFHFDGKGNPDLLWALFRQARNDDGNLAPDSCKAALDIKGVKTRKLTQCLFLINPDCFMPVDDWTLNFHAALGMPSYNDAKTKIERNGVEEYQTILKGFRAAFPQCDFCEINTALYHLGQWKNNEFGSKFFQVSTDVAGDGIDFWQEFSDNYHIRIRSEGSGTELSAQASNTAPNPEVEPAQGDIVLVSDGGKNGRAIGVVYKNDDASQTSNEERVIDVLWLNKSPSALGGITGETGFSRLYESGEKHHAFGRADAYRPTFKLIDGIRNQNSGLTENVVKDELPNTGEQMTHSLNQILYGPPGTGKTWNTVNHALAIIEGKRAKDIENEERRLLKQRFDKLKASGQVEMVTFHQNFSYEDFIEGIKPVLGDNSDTVGYEIVDGIFKQISNRAHANLMNSSHQAEALDVDALLRDFAQHINEKLEQDETIKLYLNPKYSTLIVGTEILINGRIQFRLDSSRRSKEHLVSSRTILRDYQDFLDSKIKTYKDIKPAYTSTSEYHGHAIYLCDLMRLMKEYQDKEWQPTEKAKEEKRNYVLIIDEINRGNIAKIFGELITLIEPTKRLAEDDATTVILPYSKDEEDPFGVPNNLYIIGTMNTADRSIALLDTALRRRFDFVEMMPEPSHPLINANIEGVDCRKLLSVVNKRITALLDREHQIGHSYFIGVSSMEELARAFQTKIIPLLQEYFYDDWERIYLVLNKNKFVTESGAEENLFGGSESVDTDRLSYELLEAGSDEWTTPENYRKIYAMTQPQPNDGDG